MCIKRFEELTAELEEKLVFFDEISTRDKDRKHTIYKLEQGTAVSFDLKRSPRGDVFESLLTAGTIFPLHEHRNSDETLILMEGALTVVCDEPEGDCNHEMIIGVPLHIKAGKKHFLSAKEDSWILAIIIPPDSEMLK